VVTLLAADSVTGFVHPDKIWRNVGAVPFSHLRDGALNGDGRRVEEGTDHVCSGPGVGTAGSLEPPLHPC